METRDNAHVFGHLSVYSQLSCLPVYLSTALSTQSFSGHVFSPKVVRQLFRNTVIRASVKECS